MQPPFHSADLFSGGRMLSQLVERVGQSLGGELQTIGPEGQQ